MNANQVKAALDQSSISSGIPREALGQMLMEFLEELRKGARWPWSWLLGSLIGYIEKALSKA